MAMKSGLEGGQAAYEGLKAQNEEGDEGTWDGGAQLELTAYQANMDTSWVFLMFPITAYIT